MVITSPTVCQFIPHILQGLGRIIWSHNLQDLSDCTDLDRATDPEIFLKQAEPVHHLRLRRCQRFALRLLRGRAGRTWSDNGRSLARVRDYAHYRSEEHT